MTSYKELGLVNTRDMFAKAVKGGYAIGAFNFNNMEQMQAIVQACVETKSPVILQVSRGARDYANINLLRNMARGVVEYAHELGCDIPIVLHGSSSVPQEYVKMINEYGGKLKDSVGIPEDQLRKAAKSAVCKINIDSDGRLAMTGTIRKVLAVKPSEFDPRKYLGPAREALKKMYMHKNIDVLGSAGHALD